MKTTLMLLKLIILGHIHYLTPCIKPISEVFTYVIIVDKREVLTVYFEHIHVIMLCLVFLGELPFCFKSEKFWVICII